MATVQTQQTNINDEIAREEKAQPVMKEDLDMGIKELRDRITAMNTRPVSVSPGIRLDADGFDNYNVDLIQLSHASYLRDLNKYNTIFE
jgi:hypothetical protein